MTAASPDTEELLRRSQAGDRQARGALLQRHRQRLKRMIALRLDRRLAARLGPSDLVQEALAEADRQLDDYARRRPFPFYPWLRQLAWDRLADAHRRHVQARRRSVTRGRTGDCCQVPVASFCCAFSDLLSSEASGRRASRNSSAVGASIVAPLPRRTTRSPAGPRGKNQVTAHGCQSRGRSGAASGSASAAPRWSHARRDTPARPTPPRGPTASSPRLRARPRLVSSTPRSGVRRGRPLIRAPRRASTCPSPPASQAVQARVPHLSRT